MEKQLLDAKKLVEDYLFDKDWRTKENSNAPRSFGSLNKYIIGEVSKNYWLNEVYPKRIKRAYLDGEMHIHDLGALTLYCVGYSLETILLMGVVGVSNIPVSSPAKHFKSALSQVVNLATVYQNEQAGAVAFNSVDTLLAPFIAYDSLSKEDVKQELQNFIFALNSNSRMGAEPAFTNITLDITPSPDMLDKKIIIGGKYKPEVYGDFQKEMDLFNECFTEIMLEGDAKGQPFSYPVLTYNIGKRFDWNNPKNDKIFEMAGKFGYPYFSNFVNSDMDESDIRSMCCRLRLDLTELRKRNGGLFGAGDSTGSIGVVTINMPRIGYVSKSEKEFFKRLDLVLELAKESLELKRTFLNDMILGGELLPAYMKYVSTIDNHFSTIGIIGFNEMCENFLGKDILSQEGRDFSIKVGNYILDKIKDFQVETGHLYNYEASPSESTCYRLAKKDKELFPDIITQGKTVPYYTNSCHIPVSKVTTINDMIAHQEPLQTQFTGGCVNHIYLDGAISGEQAKHIVKTCLTKYRNPYISLSPVNRYCPEHGYIEDRVEICPKCGEKLDIMQRITGYLRKVDNFNAGKKEEFYERKQFTGED